MFTTLLEARAGSSRPRGGAVVSLFAHLAAVTLAVVATQHDVGATQDPPPAETITPVYRPDPPPPPPPVAPAAPASAPVMPPPVLKIRPVVIAPVKVPTVLPAINVAAPVTADVDRKAWRTVGNEASAGTAPSGIATSPRGVYTREQVEKPAMQIAGVGVPTYPEVLKEAGFGGEVLVGFVVDTAGRAELGTLRVVRSTRPEFAKSVTEALPRMRFLPAQAGGRKVRQLVELPFQFTVR